VAERVASSRLVKLDTAELSVEPLLPGHPPPVFMDPDGRGMSEDCLLFFDLPTGSEVNSLRNFVSKAANAHVLSIGFVDLPQSALVKYYTVPGV